MDLRDRLAFHRTALANERTLLAYVRTALGLALGGASLFIFARSAWAPVFGGLLIFLGAALAAFGFWRFRKVKGEIGEGG